MRAIILLLVSLSIWGLLGMKTNEKEMFNLILVISIFILKTFDCYERMQKLIGRAS